MSPRRLRFTGAIPKALWQLLLETHPQGFSISSDTARYNADVVALGASLGWLSVISPDGLTVSRRWSLTADGLTALAHRHNFPSPPGDDDDMDTDNS